jgi:site-specific recombinase XerD
VQLRDLDLDGGTVTVRHGKGGRMRRIQLPADAIGMLRRYVKRLHCPYGMPTLGSATAREALLVGFDHPRAGCPMRPGVNQRQVQRVVAQRAHEAAARLRADAQTVPSLARIGELLDLAQRLEQATPHTLRHSLARRRLASGADLAIVQRILGHSTIATTDMYVTPSDEELRDAMERATL